MGMLDEILNSIQDSGAAGDAGPQSAPKGSQGMSPIAKALIGLFATYAAKNMGGGNMGGAPSQPGGLPPGGQGGGLGDLLGSILGGGGRLVAVDPREDWAAEAADLATCWVGCSAVAGGPGRRSTAGSATCSTNSSRGAWATQRSHGSAPARTRRFRHRTSRARSAPIPSILCRSTPA